MAGDWLSNRSTGMRRMSGERFTLYTNILIYAVDHDAGDRHAAAREIIVAASGLDCCLTLQSISEFHATATRKGRVPAHETVRYAEHLLSLFPTATASEAASGPGWRRRHPVSMRSAGSPVRHGNEDKGLGTMQPVSV